MMQSAILALAIMAGWLLMARLARSLRRRQRQRALWGLIATGVPILGWLSLRGDRSWPSTTSRRTP